MSCINLHGMSSASTHRRTTSQSQSGTETEKGAWGRFFSRVGVKTSLTQRSSKNRGRDNLHTNSMSQDLGGVAPPHVRLQQLNSGVMEGSAHLSAADLGQAERDEEAAMNDKDMRKKVREMRELVREISAENAKLKEKMVVVNNAHARAEVDKKPAAANRSSQWLLG